MDRAVWFFGSSVEYDMNEAEADVERRMAKAKDRRSVARAVTKAREHVLSQYLRQPSESDKGRFRDPADHMRNRRG